MAVRRTFGTGKGQGYLNLVPQDSLIHSLNAKGIATTGQLYAKGKKPVIYPAEKTDPISILRGKGFRKDFGTIPTPPKRGLIREIARKVHEGVDWAIDWEKNHLPAQKEWVKKEFYEAKELVKKGGKALVEGEKKIAKALKDDIKKAKEKKMLEEEKKKDLDDVRDELDINNDGVQDIPIETLDEVNQEIKYDLDQIDLDNSGTPDYIESGLTVAEPLQESIEEPIEYTNKSSISFPFPSFNPRETYGGEVLTNQPTPSTQNSIIPLPEIPVPTITPKKTFAQKTKDFASQKVAEVKTYVAEKKQEKADFITQVEKLNDNQLREIAVRTPSGLFGKNDYEKELLRRIRKRQEIADEIVTEKNKALQKSIQKKVSGSTGTGIGSYFGFLNPFTTLKPKTKKVN